MSEEEKELSEFSKLLDNTDIWIPFLNLFVGLMKYFIFLMIKNPIFVNFIEYSTSGSLYGVRNP